MYELVRTVDHVYEDGSESVLEVTAMVTEEDERAGKAGCALISHSPDHPSVVVNTVEQANRLHRALLAALSKAGHEVE